MKSRTETQPSEGAIKFQLEFSPAQPQALSAIAELNAWRQILFRAGLTGRDPARYDGLAYGNVSLRVGQSRFIVSGTQTGGKPWLTPADYCLVLNVDLLKNRIRAEGPIEPSSEAMTHGAVYEAVPLAGCVIHAHSPEIWNLAQPLGIHLTDSTIAYGTPEMGQAVGKAAASLISGVIAMGGHEDGVLAFARDPQQAAGHLMRYLAKALELKQSQFALSAKTDGHSW